MKRFEFCLIVGLALILGMCLFVPASEAFWAASTDSGSATNNASATGTTVTDSDSDTNGTSSSGFFSDMWDTICSWIPSPKKPAPPKRAPSADPPQQGE